MGAMIQFIKFFVMMVCVVLAAIGVRESLTAYWSKRMTAMKMYAGGAAIAFIAAIFLCLSL